MEIKEKTPVDEGSGNVFEDLELPGAGDLQIQAELTRQLYHRVQALGLSRVQAAKRLGLKRPEVTQLMQGRFTRLSTDRLIALLNAAEIDVEIILRPRGETNGHRGTVRVMAAVG